MSRKQRRTRLSRTVRDCGARTTVLLAALTCPLGLHAQEGALEEIEVTATRVARSGFDAPTPTTTLDATVLAARAQTNIADALNEMPLFRNSLSPQTTGPGPRGARNVADLRGLGGNRTLVLVDGQRAVPATTDGLTDINLIPTLMMERVEVVTGGASASWGSDAVSGVVNIILKKKFEGLQMDAMRAESEYGDAEESRVGIIGGTSFLDGRANAVLAVDYDDNKGVFDQYERPWGDRESGLYSNPCAGASGTPLPASLGCPGNVANGLPQRLILPDVYVGNYTSGGLITGVTGGASRSLLGTAFDANGNPYAFDFGYLATSPVATPATPTTVNTTVTQAVGQNLNANTFAASLSMLVPVERYNALGRVSFDFDGLTAFARVLYAHSEAVNVTFPTRVSSGTALTIRADNAFLPASVRALMPAGSSIRVGREIQDDFGLPLTTSVYDTLDFAAGVGGEFGQGWSWDLNAVTGRNDFDLDTDNVIIRNNFNLAVDAVTVSAANVGASGLPIGSVACRSTLTNPGNGCVPFNVFGFGAPSAEAEAYVRGNRSIDQTTKRHAAAFTLRGEPLSSWAGPISLATGLEYRKEEADVDVDSISLADGFLTTAYNAKPLHGDYDVKEAFAETVVPLLKGQELDFNAAARYADYSTSGGATTWKVGLVYSPIEQLRLRAVRSRDIRAPNLQELYAFAVPSNPNTLRNPWLGGISGFVVDVITSGNLNLEPEEADTTTLGFVFQPFSDLSLSVDYYDIDLQNAISQIANQTIIDQCFAGNATLCSLITLDANNNIRQLRNQTVNIAAFQVSGIDVQASYSLPLGSTNLRFDLSAARVLEYIQNDGITGPIDRAGQVGGNTGRPDWTGTFGTTYSFGNTTLGAQLRYVDGGLYDVLYVEGVGSTPPPGGFTINDNHIPSVTYLNLNASHDLITRDALNLQVYAVVNNALDRDPPANPAGGGATNPQFYDVIGRLYKLGLRANF